jgi:ubiquinone biosynthesis protein COQ9
MTAADSIHAPHNQEKILHAFLKHVAFEGWTFKALEQAVVEAGFQKSDVYRAFDGNPRSILDFFFQWADQATEQAIKELELTDMKIHKRISTAILIRLKLLEPYKAAVRQSLSYLSCPVRLPLAMRYLYRTVDTIWYAIGDTSVDFSYYTKRATLAAVYSPTLLKWLGDSSPDYRQTRDFLENLIATVMRGSKVKNRLQGILSC